MRLKRIMALLFVLAGLCMCKLSFAAAEPCDLVFTQSEGGKYIYCNNIESITAAQLADKSNQYAKFLMNNEGLEPDRYVFFGAFINHTNYSSIGVSSGKKGFDIEVDVLFHATEDTEITLTKLGFEVPQHQYFFLDGEQYAVENEWGGFGAWSSYFGLPIKQINSGNVYEPKQFEPVTFKVLAGEDVWLSEFIEDYRAVALMRSVHIIADFNINSGKCDVNVAALRSTGTAGDRSNFNDRASFGHYLQDKQYKGTSNGLNEVTAHLNYKIDDSVNSGTKLPVTVYNQFTPEGNTVTSWYTHLNPRADEWSYDICAESDMLSFEYYDPYKLYLYGSAINQSEKDAIYRFDTLHNDLAAYDKSYGSKQKYIPNALLNDNSPLNQACNLGNYGVICSYDLEITNTGNRQRYLIYKLATSSNNLVYVKDGDGNILDDRILCKGRTNSRISEDMASLPIPAQSTSRYTVCVVLTANYSGGMENSFVISDYRSVIETYQTERNGMAKDETFNGREYYNWSGGTINISNDRENWQKIDLPQAVIDGVAGNYSEYCLIWTGSGYVIKPTLYDAGAFYYIDHMYRDMYLLDENFNLIKKQTFGGYPQGFACANGVYYVMLSGTVFRSTTEFKWWDLTDSGLPCWNYGKYSAMSDHGVIKLSEDGENFYEAEYSGIAPTYIDAYGSWYYSVSVKTLYLSPDGLDWKPLVFTDKVKSFEIDGDIVIVNGSESLPLPEFEAAEAELIGNRYIVK